MFADAHLHLDLFSGVDLDRMLAVAREAGVTLAVTVGTDFNSSQQAVTLAEQHEGVWAGVGIHPWEAAPWRELLGEELAELAKKSTRVKVISEIGLDYSHAPVKPVRDQQETLVRQLALAHGLRLPIMTHNDRAAQDDLVKILRREGAGDLGGVIHGFRGDYRFAASCLDLGLVISFGPVILRPDGWEQVDMLRRLPRDGIVLETDAAGGDEGPREVVAVAERVAAALDMTPEQVGLLTAENLKRALRLG